MQLTVVYDNTAYQPRMTPGWGLACVVRLTDRTIMFDTGGDGAILLHNMEQAGIDPKDIDIIVLSHSHWDHVGGLDSLLTVNADIDLYFPASFPQDFGVAAERKGARVRRIDDPAPIGDRLYVTGDLEGETALAVDTGKGLVVVTGCAHPGVTRLVERAKEVSGRPVELVIGGFHLLDKSALEIADVVRSFRRLGVRSVAPIHCTGEEAKRAFEESYGENCFAAGAGWKIVR